jgi:CBS domain-containing protein
MICRDLMTSSPLHCHPDDSLSRAAYLMKTGNVGAIPVVSDEGELIGMITDRDVAIRAVAESFEPTVTPVKTVMTEKITFCRDTDDAALAVELMAQQRVRRLPILDAGGKLVGIISQADIVRRFEPGEVADFMARISDGGATPAAAQDRPRRCQKMAAAWPALVAAGAGLTGAGLVFAFGRRRGLLRRDDLKNRLARLARRALKASAGGRANAFYYLAAAVAECRGRARQKLLSRSEPERPAPAYQPEPEPVGVGVDQQC